MCWGYIKFSPIKGITSGKFKKSFSGLAASPVSYLQNHPVFQ